MGTGLVSLGGIGFKPKERGLRHNSVSWRVRWFCFWGLFSSGGNITTVLDGSNDMSRHHSLLP